MVDEINVTDLPCWPWVLAAGWQRAWHRRWVSVLAAAAEVRCHSTLCPRHCLQHTRLSLPEASVLVKYLCPTVQSCGADALRWQMMHRRIAPYAGTTISMTLCRVQVSGEPFTHLALRLRYAAAQCFGTRLALGAAELGLVAWGPLLWEWLCCPGGCCHRRAPVLCQLPARATVIPVCPGQLRHGVAADE